MKLIFAGSGSAFTVGAHNYQSNMVLEIDPQKRLLIDCGSDARLSLFEMGLTYKDIREVYISHLHADHVGGLEWLAISSYFDSACEKPTLYVPSSLVDDLWDHVLSGGLESLEDVKPELSTYFDVVPIQEEQGFEWMDLEIQLVKTHHVISAYCLCPSYGLMFNAHGKNILITTDTKFKPIEMMEWYQKADLIFHECETKEVPSSVHSHYKELRTLDQAIKNKMWLYHYNPGPLPDATKDGFLGFVNKGQSFSL